MFLGNAIFLRSPEVSFDVRCQTTPDEGTHPFSFGSTLVPSVEPTGGDAQTTRGRPSPEDCTDRPVARLVVHE